MWRDKILVCVIFFCAVPLCAMQEPQLARDKKSTSVALLQEGQQEIIKYVTNMHARGFKIGKRVTPTTTKYFITGRNYSDAVTFFCTNLLTMEGLYLCQKRECNYEGFPDQPYSDARTKFNLFRKAYELQQRLGLASQEEKEADEQEYV